MTERALGRGAPQARRRALFGLLDAGGWSWATVKAFCWFLLVIMLLGYIPDRAYYFTVFPTIDLGISAVSPINLCPPENGAGFPCPAPPGSTLAWQPSPGQLALPVPLTGGAVVQSGTSLLYIGGSAGGKATAAVEQTSVTPDGNFSPWQAAKPLPAPRTDAAVAFLSGSIYVIGGTDASGAPTDTVFVATPDANGNLGDWTTADGLKLPAARTGAAVAAAGDGLFLVGGSDGKGPTATVWKATLDSKGNLGAWQATQPLPAAEPRSDAAASLQGSYLFVYGGTGRGGPTATVLRGVVATEKTAGSVIGHWEIGGGATNLPAARSRAASFSANGTLYLVGGVGPDGTTPQNEMYWATPDASGNIAGWSHLVNDDLPASLGLAGGAATTSGTHAFIVGGTTRQGVTDGSIRADMAPQPPFFALGLVGATIPALAIKGEVGQQLGYLAAAGVGTVDFVLLILVGVAMAHPERTRELWARLRRRRA